MTNQTQVISQVLLAVGNIDKTKCMLDRQLRLKNLINEWGLTPVALAGGWTENTIRVYVASKTNLPSISLDSLTQAEHILSSIK